MTSISCKKIRDVLADAARQFEWHDYSYMFTLNSDWIDPNVTFVREASNNLSRFLTRYKNQGLQHNRFRIWGLKSDLPQTFSLDPRTLIDAPSEEGLSKLLDEFTWKSGMCIPTYGYGGALGLTLLYSNETQVSAEQEKETIQFLAPWQAQFNSWSREILEKSQLVESLSTREMECMRLVAEGKTSREIAEILSITKRTADFHIENATHKLGVSSRSQAVSRLSQLSSMRTNVAAGTRWRKLNETLASALKPCTLSIE